MNSINASARVRVLVVDDSQDSADSLATLLRQWGYEVEVAYDAGTALAQARAQQPQCMLLDIGLPDMSGYQLARQVRQQPELAEVKLIAITAYRDEPTARRAGFDYHIVKPADLKKLAALLRRILPSPEDAVSSEP